MKRYCIVGVVVVAAIIIVLIMSHRESDVSVTDTTDEAVKVNTEENTEEASTEALEETGADEVIGYTSITMDEAREIFETAGDYIILDVRRADEFAEGHIPGAINVANEDITDTEPAELPDKAQTIYVYCRSGNRSKQAAEKLAAMGYINIIEFGGIIDWTGEVVTAAAEDLEMKMTITISK